MRNKSITYVVTVTVYVVKNKQTKVFDLNS